MKILTVVGARPQFVKAAAVSRAINRDNTSNAGQLSEVIVHTGQHYDKNLSSVFFEELEIPQPDYNLGISEVSHGKMTGRMIISIEEVLEKESPAMVLIYGDTNSTLAATIAAVKLNIPIAHVEAGLRSFNRTMPEEINRIVADSLSSLLFCPTETAMENLRKEGISKGTCNVGDVMFDVTRYYEKQAKSKHDVRRWGVEAEQYVLCTVHRAENTDNVGRLKGIVNALHEIAKHLPVVLPLHPRTSKMMQASGVTLDSDNIRIIEPVSYFEMLCLESSAKAILTDSGGVQKEAFFHGVPCLTLRDETEWVETVELGVNTLCGADTDVIVSAWNQLLAFQCNSAPYGDGDAAGKIVGIIRQFLEKNNR